MAARVFISYRSSDGKDTATALARDLVAAFGDAQVFLDKDDLRGGSRWRDEVQQLLDQRPVPLLLMTPQLLAATDAVGRLRIDDPDDPVRRELADALEANAQIVPLLCDGFDAPPPASQLPPPFDQIGERTWRKLRAYDWQGDVRRLVDDLRALGVPALAAQGPVAVSAEAAGAGAGVTGFGKPAPCLAWVGAGRPGRGRHRGLVRASCFRPARRRRRMGRHDRRAAANELRLPAAGRQARADEQAGAGGRPRRLGRVPRVLARASRGWWR